MGMRDQIEELFVLIVTRDKTREALDKLDELEKTRQEIEDWCREDYKKAGATADDVLGQIEELL